MGGISPRQFVFAASREDPGSSMEGPFWPKSGHYSQIERLNCALSRLDRRGSNDQAWRNRGVEVGGTQGGVQFGRVVVTGQDQRAAHPSSRAIKRTPASMRSVGMDE